MMSLENEFLCNCCYMRDRRCEMCLAKVARRKHRVKGKAFLFPRPSPSAPRSLPPLGPAQGPLPHGLPDGGTAAGDGRGLRPAPRRGRVRPSNLSAVSSKGRKGRRAAARISLPKGHRSRSEVRTPGGAGEGLRDPACRPGPGSPPSGGRGGTHGLPEGARGFTSLRGAPAPLPPSPPRPPRLTPRLTPPAAALPGGTGREGCRRQLRGNY